MSILAQEVSWSAGGKLIVNGVTVHVRPGELLGLAGPNGSGKSSLLRLIARLQLAESGGIHLGGQDIRSLTPRQTARRLAFVEQQAETDIDMLVRDIVALGRIPHRSMLGGWSAGDQEAVDAAIARMALTPFAHRHWRTLSGGERQRVQIARALAQRPTEMILDEPTNHLDIRHQIEIMSLVAALPITAIVAIHDLNLAAAYCDKIALMKDGRLVAAGTPEEVLRAEIIEATFNVRAHIGRSARTGRLMVEFEEMAAAPAHPSREAA